LVVRSLRSDGVSELALGQLELGRSSVSPGEYWLDEASIEARRRISSTK
jgi:hypothetical protein